MLKDLRQKEEIAATEEKNLHYFFALICVGEVLELVGCA